MTQRMANDYLPTLGMVVVQIIFTGLNIVSKLAMNSGMSPVVMIAYRQLIATLALAPLAFFQERNIYSKITGRVLFQIFLCALFGATGNQLLYFIGLKHSTPTIGCALANMLPAITLIIAVPLRIEKIPIKTVAGQAKIVGTAICVGGSILMTLYQGPIITVLPASPIHWKYIKNTTASEGAGGSQTMILRAILLILSSVSWALWFIIQANMSKSFSSPYTTSTLMFLMAGVQCGAIGAGLERDLSMWALGWGISLGATLYAGFFCSALAILIMSWSIEKRGPLFASLFSPLVLIIVAVLGWAILDEKLYFGSFTGSLLIVVGLYMVLWGKGREMTKVADFGWKEVDEESGMEGSIGLALDSTTNHELQDEECERVVS